MESHCYSLPTRMCRLCPPSSSLKSLSLKLQLSLLSTLFSRRCSSKSPLVCSFVWKTGTLLCYAIWPSSSRFSSIRQPVNKEIVLIKPRPTEFIIHYSRLFNLIRVQLRYNFNDKMFIDCKDILVFILLIVIRYASYIKDQKKIFWTNIYCQWVPNQHN